MNIYGLRTRTEPFVPADKYSLYARWSNSITPYMLEFYLVRLYWPNESCDKLGCWQRFSRQRQRSLLLIVIQFFGLDECLTVKEKEPATQAGSWFSTKRSNYMVFPYSFPKELADPIFIGRKNVTLVVRNVSNHCSKGKTFGWNFDEFLLAHATFWQAQDLHPAQILKESALVLKDCLSASFTKTTCTFWFTS